MNVEALRALVAEWRQTAIHQQHVSDTFTSTGDHRQAAVARGRARQLVDCANDIAELIAGEA